MGYFLAILSITLAFALVVFAGYGKSRAAERRAGRQIR
jgi:hypothetical protein